MWKNGDSTGSDLVQRIGTTQALQGFCSRHVHSGSDSQTPKLREIVQSDCAASDKAAPRPESIWRGNAGRNLH
jgi:hypothetical protein